MSLASDFGAGAMKVLWPLMEPKIDELQTKLLALGAAQLQAFQEKALAMLPLVSATVVKLALERVFDHIPGIEVPPLNVDDLAELARGDLNKIPDIDIKGLSDIFDVTEWVAGLGIKLGK